MDPALLRKIVLRPNPFDHFDPTQDFDNNGWTPGETFDDSNLNGQWDVGEPFDDADGDGQHDSPEASFGNVFFDAVNGPWDVDNDGDGLPDSVWVDLGARVQTMRDGRQVKPLFAIFCIDLDGRINLNAHGTPGHLAWAVDNPSGEPEDLVTMLSNSYWTD